MNKKIFNQKQFNNLIIEDFNKAYKYLLETNNINLLIKYKKFMSKYKRYNYNKILSDELNELRYFYYNNLKNIFNNSRLIQFNFNNIINKINEYQYYYFLNNNIDLYIFKSIEIININLKLLEGDYNLKINIVSNFIFKGYINYISLNKITLKYFIFNNQLYIIKDYYNKNINSKKFKLFLISKAQYLHDINKQYSLDEIKKRCNNILSLYKF